MSLLSQFGDNGYIATVGSVGLRKIPITGQFGQGLLSCIGIEVSDNVTRLVACHDSTATTEPCFFNYFTLSDKKSVITQFSGSKVATSSTRPMIINPINGGIIRRNPTNASEIAQSLDKGATWSYISAGASTGTWEYANSSQLSGGWFDGTTFAYTNVSQSFQTTDGVNFSSLSNPFTYSPAFPGNSRSAYSGYYFSMTLPNYRYRTSLNGTDTQVNGYGLLGKSCNGRYMVRQNSTTNIKEYSTDGGASWSSFTNDFYEGNGGFPYSSTFCISNDGTFFAKTANGGALIYYDFSQSKWSCVGGDISLGYGHWYGVPIPLGGQEALLGFHSGSQNAQGSWFLQDMPRLPG